MLYTEIHLDQMLKAREERQQRCISLLSRYKKPVVCITMSIAGPIKISPMIVFAFKHIVSLFEEAAGYSLYEFESITSTGCEYYYVSNRCAASLKEIAVLIEESAPLGRLADIDVLDERGMKLSRPHPRSCLICSGAAAACSRSRAHGLTAVTEKTHEILCKSNADVIGGIAVDALISEVNLTPKPGLVDRNNSGSHKDMDIGLMEQSAHCLKNYFSEAALLGIISPCCMPLLQQAGIKAEAHMLRTTHGINTHKGAIYAIGLLCAAAGSHLAFGCDPWKQAAALAKAQSVSTESSHGMTVKRLYLAGGARSEAMAGFPHVQSALKYLSSSPLSALLYLIANTDDTNLLWRGGRSGLAFAQKQANSAFLLPPESIERYVLNMDTLFISKNLSPGGCADLLAAALFMERIFKMCI